MHRVVRQLLGTFLAALATPAWAAQYHVRVSVDQITAGYQRGKSPDRDYLTLYATSTHDPSSRANSAPTDVGTFSTNTKVNLSPGVLTDELLVSDADTIQLFADLENKSHSDSSKALSDGLKIAGAVITVLGAGEILQSNLASGSWAKSLERQGGVVTLSGAVLALAGEVIGDLGGWLGLSDPDCDGPVFAPRSPVLLDVGKFFASFHGPIPLDTPLGVMLWTDDSQSNGDQCGHTPSATLRVNLVLTRPPDDGDSPSLGVVPGPTTHFRPIASGLRANALAGTWAERPFVEGSRVTVSVRELQRPRLGSGLRAGGGTTVRFDPRVLGWLGQPPQGHATLPSTALPDPLSVDVQEQLPAGAGPSALRISAATTTTVPMQSASYQGDRFQWRGGGVVIRVASPTASSPTRNFTRVPMVVPAGRAGADGPVRQLGATSVVAFADSLPLPQGVTLQLYGGYDAQERFTGTRLRYLRTDAQGAVVTDVMLQGAQHVPR